MSTAPAPQPVTTPPGVARIFLSAGIDAGEYVEEIRLSLERAGGFEVVKYPPSVPLVDVQFDVELEGMDAAVVVLTPGYLSTAQAISNEYPELLRAERQGALPVLWVLGSRLDAAGYERLSISPEQLLTSEPLAEMDGTERGATIETLVRRVEAFVSDPDAGPVNSEPASPPAGAAEDGVVSGHFALPTDYRLVPAVQEILSRAWLYAESAPVTVAVTTPTLLLAIVEVGKEDPDPGWTGEWLSRRLGDVAINELRNELITQQHIGQLPLRGTAALRAPASVFSPGTVRVFASAAAIAGSTTGSDEIHTRHLVAALLANRDGAARPGALDALEARGLAAAELRRELFDYVRGDGDDDAEWGKILLGREVRVYRMAGFHADDTRGEDLLGIEQDVLAFATLIAARTVTPPLSIGLFGEWGSGKSFFMRRLRDAVAGLARDAAKSGQMQRDLPFYKRIVQIEFNAWHYVEGNLWASLVEHIFRNLSIPGDQPTASQALQKRLMDDLEFTEQARAEVNEERRRALREVATARKRVSAARREHERQREALADLAAREVASDLTTEEVRSAVGPVLERLGMPAVAASARDLLGALGEARALVERGRGAFLPLVRAPAGERRRRWTLLLMVMLLGPVVGWLVGVAVRSLGDAPMAQLSAFASGAATLLTAGAAWVRSQVKWGSDRLAEVEKAQREVDRRLADKQAEQTRELRILQEQLQLARADYEAARRRQVESEKRVKEAKTKLEEGSVARLLASFIEDRAASADYRKHLGVLALVRNDFEKLSGLIEEENWCLSPAGHDDDRYPGLHRFETPDDEKKGAEGRINRIVLYIDDLDRCPPNKVVEVLQAVHLLLAFPLFVVVVGVDARWVKRSLEVRYRELLHGADARDPLHRADADESITSAKLLIGKATTDDYLEKIFQVPFWLRPMDEAHTGRMVHGLLAGSVAVPPAAPTPAQPAETAPDQVDSATNLAGEGRLRLERVGSPPITVRMDAPELVLKGRLSGKEPPPEPQVNLESLVFHPEELEFMAALAPLLDRSPRALKRFVNVYRLIKAGLTPAEQRAFLGGERVAAPYRVVLFLLTVDAGLPEIADAFFAALRSVDPELGGGTGEGAATLLGLVESRVEALGALGDGRPWARLHAWLRPEPGHEPYLDPPPAVLAEWEPRVMRYSFRARG